MPQNLTDQFTIATWMKHGPSPGLRVEKETILCNSDKTGKDNRSHQLDVTNINLLFVCFSTLQFICVKIHLLISDTP